jgi:hypothetical protein
VKIFGALKEQQTAESANDSDSGTDIIVSKLSSGDNEKDILELSDYSNQLVFSKRNHHPTILPFTANLEVQFIF